MSEGKTVGYTIAYTMIVIGLIVSCLLISFGALLIVGSSDRQAGDPGWLGVGVIFLVAGLVIAGLAVGVFVFLRVRRSREAQQAQEIIQKIDLSGDIEMETLKCQKCGGELQKDSITIKEGAVFISCPYCGSAYQMVEDPKW